MLILRKLKQGKLGPKALTYIIDKAKETLSKRVIIGPSIGLDSAVVKAGGVISITTDPAIMIPRNIPLEMFAFGTVHFAASDTVVIGARPIYMVYTLLLPIGYEEEKALRIINLVSQEAKTLGISIVGGHTGAYAGIEVPISSTTVIGEVIRVLSPKNLRIGDEVIVTDKIGLEFAVALAYDKFEAVSKVLGTEKAMKLRENWREETVFWEALELINIPEVVAMHDVTEGGLIGSLWEWRYASGSGIRVDYESIPVREEVDVLLDSLGVNRMQVSSTGALLIGVKRGSSDVVLRKLKLLGLNANVIGKIVPGNDVEVYEKGKKIKVELKDIYSEIFG